MNIQKVKERVIMTAAIIGFAVLGLIFWKLVAAFMWACYYAGITM